MVDHYKSAMGKINIPKELIEKTTKKAKQKQQLGGLTNNNKMRVYAAFAASFIIIILAIATINRQSNDRIILTDMKVNDRLSTVLVKGGTLQFNDFQDGLDNQKVNQNLGIPESLSKPWTKEEYMSYLGKNIELSYLPSGFTLEKEAIRIYENKEGVIKSDEYYVLYTADEEQKIVLYLRKGKLPSVAYLDLEKVSEIKETSLNVAYMKEMNGFFAQFILDDVGYYVAVENITQKEFIKILYSFFE